VAALRRLAVRRKKEKKKRKAFYLQTVELRVKKRDVHTMILSVTGGGGKRVVLDFEAAPKGGPWGTMLHTAVDRKKEKENRR